MYAGHDRARSVLLSALCAYSAVSSSACDDATGEPATPPAASVATRVTVHEWGLVAHYYGDHGALADVVSGGARTAHALVLGHGAGHGYGGKPVIYVGVTGGDARLTVRVSAPGGAIVEHLPPATTIARDSVEWSELVASVESCPTSTRVTIDDPRCETPDDYCEALENPDFDADDAACLTGASGARDNHLFYRARVAVDDLPLVVTRPDAANPGWDVRNRGTAPIPGKLVMVWRYGGNTPPRVALVDPPMPGASSSLPIDGPLMAQSECTATLRRMLSGTGLSPNETDAFLRAWDTSIFGYVDHPGDIPAGRTPPAVLRQTPIALYYFAPAESLAHTLPLDVTPAPDALVRAILVKVDLFDPPEGTIGLGTLGTIGYGTSGHGTSGAGTNATIRTGAAEVSDGLPSEIVRRVVRRHINEVRRCVELHRSSAEDEGRLAISFDVNPTGHVANVAEANSTLSRGQDVSMCVRDVMRRWEFPPPQNGATVHVTYPFMIVAVTE